MKRDEFDDDDEVDYCVYCQKSFYGSTCPYCARRESKEEQREYEKQKN
jgi:hypothetical protein